MVVALVQGGFVTTSEVDVVVTERDNDVIYQCHGTNEQLGQTVVDTITLTVMCTHSFHTHVPHEYSTRLRGWRLGVVVALFVA